MRKHKNEWLEAEQLDLKIESGIGGNHVTGASSSVTELRRDDETALSADFHASDALIPAADDGACVVFEASE